MQFNIRGANMEVTPSLREFVEKKLGKLERYFESPLTSEANVTLRVVKDIQRVEVTIPLTGVLLRAEDKSNDMYASIDAVVDKLERQIRKHKTRVNRKLRQESGQMKNYFVEDPAVNGGAAEEDSFELVRTKRFNLKPMDVEEAILQMNMIGHNFFVFSNTEDSENVNVVYKRHDGTYGLIEPTA